MIKLLINLIPKRYLTTARKLIYKRLGWTPISLADIDKAMRQGYLACEDDVKKQIFLYFLKPLIEDNYRKRIKGELPDEWFWADSMYGYFITGDDPFEWEYHKPGIREPIDWKFLAKKLSEPA